MIKISEYMKKAVTCVTQFYHRVAMTQIVINTHFTTFRPVLYKL